MSLRFAVGDRVQCKTSRVRWQKGHVSLLHYREDHWPEGQVAPYQIKLDDGRLIYCPADSDSLIRAAVDGDGDSSTENPAEILVCHGGACRRQGAEAALLVIEELASSLGSACLLYTSPSPRDS